MELRVIPQGRGRVSVLLVEDVTDLVEAREARVALRERLANADRLATAGLLAAGLGHEIKNPLTLVRSNLELLDLELERQRKSPEELRHLVDRGLSGVDRVDDVIRGMRKLARSDTRLEPLALHQVLASTLDLASAGLGGVRVEQEPSPVPTRPTKGGTGLGLAISRQIVEEMGGSLELVEQPLPGALFRVSLLTGAEERATA